MAKCSDEEKCTINEFLPENNVVYDTVEFEFFVPKHLPRTVNRRKRTFGHIQERKVCLKPDSSKDRMDRSFN